MPTRFSSMALTPGHLYCSVHRRKVKFPQSPSAFCKLCQTWIQHVSGQKGYISNLNSPWSCYGCSFAAGPQEGEDPWSSEAMQKEGTRGREAEGSNKAFKNCPLPESKALSPEAVSTPTILDWPKHSKWGIFFRKAKTCFFLLHRSLKPTSPRNSPPTCTLETGVPDWPLDGPLMILKTKSFG